MKEPGRRLRSFPMQKFKPTRERRALAKARAEAKLKRWRESHEYAERVFLRLVKRLRAVREARGLSRYALAEAAGMSRDMVGCIEAGKSCPTAIVLVKVAKAFRVPLPKALVALSSWLRR